MTASPKHFSRLIGCDAGKASIVACDSLTQQITTVTNCAADLAAWMRTLDDTCLVICEATGGYEAELLAAAVTAGISAHRADARKVKAFIRSFGILGKTDAIDARALMCYGQERQALLALWLPSEPHQERLRKLVVTRREFVNQQTACSNRLAAPADKAAHPYLKKLLKCLAQQIKGIEAAITALIGTTPQLRQASEVLQSICGIGAHSAAALLGLLPELGHVDRRQAASLAGLAPHPKQSATKDGYRRMRGGRSIVRTELHMAAQSAAMHHKTLSVFYRKLIAGGKLAAVARGAVMRKLVVIANAKLRTVYATQA